MKIAVVIANWNGKKYLRDCFDSLAGQTFQDFNIIFVDNGSEDDSVEYLRKNYAKKFFSSRLDIISLSKNIGFSRGYNLGITEALKKEKTKYIFVLNNDTKLGEKCLEELLTLAEYYPQAGSIQSQVINFFEKNQIDCAGIVLAKDGTAHNRGYGEKKQDYEQEEEIFGANGTASLFSREALEKTKLSQDEYFDDAYFAYYEDSDLAWRMRLAGYKSYYCPSAVVFHLHSATTGKYSLFKAYYLHRNYFFTVFKNYPFGIMVGVLTKRFESYLLLFFNVFRKSKEKNEYAKNYGKKELAGAIFRAWKSVIWNAPKIWRKRKIIQKKRKVSSGEIVLWLKKYSEN